MGGLGGGVEGKRGGNGGESGKDTERCRVEKIALWKYTGYLVATRNDFKMKKL